MFEHHRHEEYWQGDYTKWNIAKKCPTAKFSHFCALDVASADNYFHRGVCACSAEDTNKNMEYSTSQQVHKQASLGFRCAQ